MRLLSLLVSNLTSLVSCLCRSNRHAVLTRSIHILARRFKECSWFKFFLLIILNRSNTRVFCLSSCHRDDKILNRMIFISNFPRSSAFYLTFSSACRLLVACTLRLLKSARSRKLCTRSTHSASSSRSVSMSFKLLIISRLYCS